MGPAGGEDGEGERDVPPRSPSRCCRRFGRTSAHATATVWNVREPGTASAGLVKIGNLLISHQTPFPPQTSAASRRSLPDRNHSMRAAKPAGQGFGESQAKMDPGTVVFLGGKGAI
jgi:hypothetical protein